MAFIFYFLLRSYLQIPGNEHQTNIQYLIDSFFKFSVTKDFLMQAVFANNIIIFVVLLVTADRFRSFKYFLPFIVVLLILSALGIASGIGNNLGRILNIALPLLIIGLTEMMCIGRLRDQAKP